MLLQHHVISFHVITSSYKYITIHHHIIRHLHFYDRVREIRIWLSSIIHYSFLAFAFYIMAWLLGNGRVKR